VVFSVTSVRNSGLGAIFECDNPQWCGRWVLDKACSDCMEPLLSDLGVNYILRKAADAANTMMTIRVSRTHVNINLKIWISVEDSIPLDGSWTTKPVPRGGKYRGTCRVRLTRISHTELEMLSKFDDDSEIRDTLSMLADGASFLRVMSRGDRTVKRIFRLHDQ